MSDGTRRVLLSAAASSAMEGLPLDSKKLEVVEKILDGDMTLQDFFESLKLKYQEN